MRETYTTPELEIVRFDTVDVITDSNTTEEVPFE